MTRRKAQARKGPPPRKGAKRGTGSSAKRARRPQARRRNPVALGAVAAALVAVVAMVSFALLRKEPAPASSGGGAAAARKLQAVPDSTFVAVGVQTGVTPPTRLPPGMPAFAQDGKPEVLYIGANYCPFCAAQRWALILALSRFGSFSGLSATRSSTTDVFPNTATFSFHGSTYTSDLLAFEGVEETTNQPDGNGGYTPLDTPTAGQLALLRRFDVAPYTNRPGAIPFVMLGNGFVSVGAGFQPSDLAGMTVDEVVAKLANLEDPLTKDMIGLANTMVAALCELTNGKPTTTCSAPFVGKIQGSLPSAP